MTTIGDLFTNRHEEHDLDEFDRRRITPAGNVWRIADRNTDRVWDLVCDKTGAWIVVSQSELDKFFDPCQGD